MAKRGRPKKIPNLKELLNQYIPAADIFTEEESKMYEGLVGVYLNDFEEDQLTANDMDDIMSIAMNRVLEIRLLKASRGNATMQLDSSAAIEKLRRQTDKLKESLASRRRDRIDPRKYNGLSIVDLAIAFDSDRKHQLANKSLKLRGEEDEIRKSKLLIGNRDDGDAETINEEE
jgi:hypothetical protein